MVLPGFVTAFERAKHPQVELGPRAALVLGLPLPLLRVAALVPVVATPRRDDEALAPTEL
jgi:hypothetical protein